MFFSLLFRLHNTDGEAAAAAAAAARSRGCAFYGSGAINTAATRYRRGSGGWPARVDVSPFSTFSFAMCVSFFVCVCVCRLSFVIILGGS